MKKSNPMQASIGGRTAAAALALAARFGLAVGLSVFLIVGVQPALTSRASPPYQLVKAYPNPTAADNEQFGSALALPPAGNHLIVAARGDRLGGANPIGAVYVLTTTTGAITHVLSETSPAPLDYFGYSLAVSGTMALAGAELNDTGATDAGAAFLYDTATGALSHSFFNPNAGAEDYFGSSVAILSSTAILVGAPQYDVPSPPATNAGRVYVCQIASGLCPTAIDTPSLLPSNGEFGLAVVSLGTWFAVAAPFDGAHGTVYVFTTTTGLLYKTITLPISDTLTGDNFGSSLAAVNGNLLIGAQNGPTSIVNTPGAAYLYSPAGVLLRKFPNPDSGDSGARFGAAVAGDGNVVLIGAPGAAGDEGRAYLLNASTGALIQTLQIDVPSAGDHFGNAVAMLGENFVVGAPDVSVQGHAGAGVVYRFGVQVEWDLHLPLVHK